MPAGRRLVAVDGTTFNLLNCPDNNSSVLPTGLDRMLNQTGEAFTGEHQMAGPSIDWLAPELLMLTDRRFAALDLLSKPH